MAISVVMVIFIFIVISICSIVVVSSLLCGERLFGVFCCADTSCKSSKVNMQWWWCKRKWGFLWWFWGYRHCHCCHCHLNWHCCVIVALVGIIWEVYCAVLAARAARLMHSGGGRGRVGFSLLSLRV